MTIPPILLGVIVGLSFAAGIGYGHWRSRIVLRHELELWRQRHDPARWSPPES